MEEALNLEVIIAKSFCQESDTDSDATASRQGSPELPRDPSDDSQSDSDTKKAINWHVKPYELPPCRVCGAKGTGYHYGVNTCEACKTFFRRASSRHEKLKCKSSAKCNMAPSNGSLCAKCRFLRCLQAGMSAQGIKYGRYSFDKIVQDTREVKLRKARESHDRHTTLDAHKVAALQELTTIVSEAARKYISHARKLDQSCAMEMRTLTLTKSPVSNTVFDDMSHLIEGDSRVDLYNRIFAVMGQIVQTLVKFVKAVPGFRQLPMEDQIALFKGSFSDLRFLAIYPMVNVETRKVFNKFDVLKAVGENFGEKAIKMATRLQRLNLTEEEQALLSVLVVFISDRCELIETEQVAAIHDSILESLQHSFHLNHNSDTLLFPRLVSALTEMRSFGSMVRDFFAEIVRTNEGRGVVEVPTIMMEMLLW